MAKKKQRPSKSNLSFRYEIKGIFMLTLSVLVLVCLIGSSPGIIGGFTSRVFKGFLGRTAYLIPLLMAIAGIKLCQEKEKFSLSAGLFGLTGWGIILATVFHLHFTRAEMFTRGLQGQGGGLVGAACAYGLTYCFGLIGTYIILASCALISTILILGRHTATVLRFFKNGALDTIQESKKAGQKALDTLGDLPKPTAFFHVDKTSDDNFNNQLTGPLPKIKLAETKINPLPTESVAEPPAKAEAPKNEEEFAAADEPSTLTLNPGNYKLPPLSLLAPPKAAKTGNIEKEINENIKTLETVLANFGISAKVVEVSQGPAITRYELQPPPGVKVSRIVGLADDIALGLATADVRIEAPIPGKSAVGIEVPNRNVAMVHLAELLEKPEFTQSGKLTVALGKAISGSAIVADLGKMPHLLIAGATGSGKSVCVNTLITSILFKATPEEVKLLMVDPKMVELANYNGIPHLISPVVTNAKKAAGALRWAVREMENRYELFSQAGVRDISRYNQMFTTNTAGEGQKPLPYIVIIIDELADLMMVAPADVEDAICRLAQMARAAGMHLVVATQRPSVDVITGLIKANIPSRISFAVSSQVDSRTILDVGGAEKLLGKGDMLFNPVGAAKPIRVQGAYLSDQEVENLVDFLKKQGEPEFDENVTAEEPESQKEAEDVIEDELLPVGVKILIESGTASISMLQRRLKIGYARAARLIDMMEQRGIVGGYEGSKPRAILMTLAQYEQTFGQAKNDDGSPNQIPLKKNA